MMSRCLKLARCCVQPYFKTTTTTVAACSSRRLSSSTSSPQQHLAGITVVALEQALAAPLTTCRLADAGARVIKIEREGSGDFARQYDAMVLGNSTYFTWVNRGKESLELDVKDSESIKLLYRILAKADVFVQNLGHGAAERLGLGSATLAEKFPHLITMDISGYGESGPKASLAAYDLLVQSESGICVASGLPGKPTRVGLSVVDIATGMNAFGAITQALYARERNGGKGCSLKTSLFGTASEMMTVPYLQQSYTKNAPTNVGLAHPSIVPYRAYACSDGKEVLLAVQNEREWVRLCELALELPQLAIDPRFCGSFERMSNRHELDDLISTVSKNFSRDEWMSKLQKAKVGCAAVNTVEDLVSHPQLRVATQPTHAGDAVVIANPVIINSDMNPPLRALPALGEHTDQIKKEFAA